MSIAFGSFIRQPSEQSLRSSDNLRSRALFRCGRSSRQPLHHGDKRRGRSLFIHMALSFQILTCWIAGD